MLATWRRRPLPAIALGLPIVFVVSWVLFFASGTSAGAAIHEPGKFLVTLLDGVTFAGLMFVVASGFTLIFGLMRTVNMAHGALFLLAAYIAIDLQQRMVGKSRNLEPKDVPIASWVVPMLVGARGRGILGLVVQQVFLRWNQGQDLRQALITVAISVIVADQLLARFGGLAKRMVWPAAVTHFFNDLRPTVRDQSVVHARRRVARRRAVVAVAQQNAHGPCHPGRRRRPGGWFERSVSMSTPVFAVTFFVGAFLAGMGGAMGASFAGVAPGADGQWLLNSLVVVIIGGLGSIKGAAAGSLLVRPRRRVLTRLLAQRLHLLRDHPDVRCCSLSFSPCARMACSDGSNEHPPHAAVAGTSCRLVVARSSHRPT